MITHTSFSEAQSWGTAQQKRLTFLVDGNCSACAEWLSSTVNSFNIPEWEFSQLAMEEFLEESNGLPVNETTGNWYRLGMSAIMTEAQLKRHLKVCLSPDESTPEGYIN
jgi:hypothetical protein